LKGTYHYFLEPYTVEELQAQKEALTVIMNSNRLSAVQVKRKNKRKKPDTETATATVPTSSSSSSSSSAEAKIAEETAPVPVHEPLTRRRTGKVFQKHFVRIDARIAALQAGEVTVAEKEAFFADYPCRSCLRPVSKCDGAQKGYDCFSCSQA
jgi:hypothetical protein